MKNFRLIFVIVLLAAHAAFAVIQLKLPVSKIYSTSSPVHVAKITALNPANRSIEAQTDSDKLRLHLVQPQALFASLKIGDPVVVFIAKGRGSNTATVHLADTWLLANLKPESKIWEITQEQSNDFRKAFPGSTKALTQIVAEFRDNKSSLMSAAEERVFTEGASQVTQLNITANNIFTADLNADNIPEVIISTPHGPKIFSKSADTYADTTANWSLPAEGALLAVGDLNSDGKPDLIIDKTPYINQGTSFKPAAALDIPDKSDLLAITIADGKLVSLSKSGQLSIGPDKKQLWLDKDSPPRLAAILGPFDEENKLAAIVLTDTSLNRYSLDGRVQDFSRLTGEILSPYLKDSEGKFKNPRLIPLDVNGDKRADVFILCDGGSFLLINRGFGTYFVSPAAANLALGSAPDKPFPYASSAASSRWAAIDTRGDHHEDLLILTPDGALYRLGNPPPK